MKVVSELSYYDLLTITLKDICYHGSFKKNIIKIFLK